MPNLASWSLIWLVAYVIGSIPFGFLIARSNGIDIRQHGSGNIGATNVGRVLGRRLGLFCFGLDVLKGLVPSVLAGVIMDVHARADLPPLVALAWLGVPVAAIMGHMFPVWLKFRGGKGVATGLGALVGVFPVMTFAAIVVLLIWIASAKITRYVGISSCLAALCMPPATLGSALLSRSPYSPLRLIDSKVHHVMPSIEALLDNAWPYLVVTLILAAIVIYKHRGNIQRTIAGTEMKIGQRVHVSAADSTTP